MLETLDDIKSKRNKMTHPIDYKFNTAHKLK